MPMGRGLFDYMSNRTLPIDRCDIIFADGGIDMIIERKVKIDESMVNKSNEITNKELLEVLVDTAGKHSDLIGNSFDEFMKEKRAWIILAWKVNVIKRPKLDDEILIKTWVEEDTGIFSIRDFEVTDKEDKPIVKASSKWCIMNVETRRPVRFEQELIDAYGAEPRRIFDGKFEKIKIPEMFSNEVEYIVKESDVDNIKHFHNTNYLNAAYTSVKDYDENVKQFDNICMEFKKEILLDEHVNVCYANVDESNIIVLKTNDKVNAIISLS